MTCSSHPPPSAALSQRSGRPPELSAQVRDGQRRRAPRAVIALLSAAFVTSLVAGCSGQATGSSDPTTTPPGGTTSAPTSPVTTDDTTAPPPPQPAKAPATGTCRRLDYSAISRYSNSDATVPCNAPHTAYTFAVRSIPSNVSVPGVSIGNKSIQDAAASSCRDAFAGFIGGTPAVRALSRLSVTYFLPEQRDFNLGAHWVRCDVVALETFNRLATLPANVTGLLGRPDALTTYGLCSTDDPGATSSRLVMCAEKHAFRAETAIRLGAEGDPYPGDATVAVGGKHRCRTYLTDQLGASAGFTFGWTFPTDTDWAAGQRFGYCYLKTPK